MVTLRRPPKECFSIAKCIRRFSLTRKPPRRLSGDFSADFDRSKAAKLLRHNKKPTIIKTINIQKALRRLSAIPPSILSLKSGKTLKTQNKSNYQPKTNIIIAPAAPEQRLFFQKPQPRLQHLCNYPGRVPVVIAASPYVAGKHALEIIRLVILLSLLAGY